MTLQRLSFINCGVKLTYNKINSSLFTFARHHSAALFFMEVENIKLNYVNIISSGFAVVGYNSTNATFDTVYISTANIYSINHSVGSGVLILLDSFDLYNSSDIIINNSTFTHNIDNIDNCSNTHTHCVIDFHKKSKPTPIFNAAALTVLYFRE